MKGERFSWFQLAARLHMPLQELQRKTTSREFLEWQLFIEEEATQFEKRDYYDAQIAKEIRAGRAKNPGKLKVTDFLIKFKPRERPKPRKPLTEAERAAYIAKSKGFWKGLMHKFKKE